MTSTASPSARPVTRPAQLAGAVAQLAVLGVAGPILLTIVVSMLGLGIALLFVVGIGLLVLAALVYVLFAIGWIETQRVEGLYGFGLTAPRPRTSGRTGFGGVVRTVWLQAIDPTTWRAIASLVIATIFGWIVVALAGLFASGIAMAFAPLFAQSPAVRLARTGIEVPLAGAVPVGILTVLLSAAAIVGLAILHGLIARAILVPSREAQLAEAVRTSTVQHAGAVRAADVERSRIERDLHDGVQPRLVSVGMTLGLAQQKIDADPDAAKALISEAHTSTKAAITELRQLARGIHTSVLDDRGLDAALSALVGRSVIPVHMDIRLDGRCSRDAEAAAYFAIAEALTNATKHSRATEVRLVARLREPGVLWARVEDNGVGGARVMPGGGLDGIVNRVIAAGGEARIDSPVGGPTSVEVSIPCAS